MGRLPVWMSLFGLVYVAVVVFVVAAVVVALWRSMQAQERMERHLARIADALGEARSERPLP